MVASRSRIGRRLRRAGRCEKLVAVLLAAIFLTGVAMIAGGLLTQSPGVAMDSTPAPAQYTERGRYTEQGASGTPVSEPQ